MNALRVIALCAVLCAAQGALGCGYCDEDRIAAVYDHGVVAHAAATAHQIVFLALESGAVVTPQREAAIKRAVSSAAGVDRGTVRIALAAGAMSFAYDARRYTADEVIGAVGRQVAALGVRTEVVRTGPSSPIQNSH